MYPDKLDKIINLFEMLPEDERRETIVSYADTPRNRSRGQEKNSISKMSAKMRNAPTPSVFICRSTKRARRNSA